MARLDAAPSPASVSGHPIDSLDPPQMGTDFVMTSGLPSEATWPRMIHPDPVTEMLMVPVDCATAAVAAIKADRSMASILAK